MGKNASYLNSLRHKEWWIASRKSKAFKIIKILSEESGSLKDKTILDLGCSVGVITKELAKTALFAVGVDIDKHAISLAKKSGNMAILFSDGSWLPFKSNAFDVVCCNQVIEYVNCKEMLAKEIHRVLKPGGVCYLGAVNNLFTSILNKSANYGQPCFYWNLKKIFRMFHVEDRTPKILKDSNGYLVENMPNCFGKIFHALPTYILKFLTPFSLSWVFILVKPKNNLDGAKQV
jgi:2-polyprenyl-3-methyl-5-hydroxy-6-metoxy-1,4-benzoquinol methylase